MVLFVCSLLRSASQRSHTWTDVEYFLIIVTLFLSLLNALKLIVFILVNAFIFNDFFIYFKVIIIAIVRLKPSFLYFLIVFIVTFISLKNIFYIINTLTCKFWDLPLLFHRNHQFSCFQIAICFCLHFNEIADYLSKFLIGKLRNGNNYQRNEIPPILLTMARSSLFSLFVWLIYSIVNLSNSKWINAKVLHFITK